VTSGTPLLSGPHPRPSRIDHHGRSAGPPWFGLYIGLEETASRLRCFEPEMVHWLLQTEDYARAVIASEDALEPEVVDQRVRSGWIASVGSSAAGPT
jgi:hypothetical protein